MLQDLNQHCRLLIESYRRLTGRELLPGQSDAKEAVVALASAPFVLVSHGTEPDPILNYGNSKALELWEMTWEELTRTPSRLTAEAPNREERARLLETVSRRGFIDDYAGVRISKGSRRFRIEDATVWNLITESGIYWGQAAKFSDWTYL